MKFSEQTRKENLEKLMSSPLDVLIIGGGITGAGIALQSAAMGYKTGLLEMQDFAGGTSSRSTKLVHGGLRYLKQFEVEMVSDVAKERAVLHQNAPHIVKPQKMLLPIYDEPGASFTDFSAPIALKLYDELAQIEQQNQHTFLSKEEVLDEVPTLRKNGLVKGGIYLDYRSDDARLTIETIKKAAELGALPVNYVKAERFLFDENRKIVGAQAVDQWTGRCYSIPSKVVINAGGPWSDDIRHMLGKQTENRLHPTKGVHLVVAKEKLPVNRPIYTDTGFGDDRMIFVIPRNNKTYFGTTDTSYEGERMAPEVTMEDVNYLLKAINFRFPEVTLTIEDIETSWAGLRPLIAEKNTQEPSKISRTHDVFVSEEGLITIAGGKLTDYRIMSEDTLESARTLLEKETGKQPSLTDTKNISLSGGEFPRMKGKANWYNQTKKIGLNIGLSEEESEWFIRWYGANAEKLFQMPKKKYFQGMDLADSLSLQYSLEYEMVLTPIDYFLRRTDFLLFDIKRVERMKEPVLLAMQEYFGWDLNTFLKHKKDLEQTINNVRLKHLRKQ